MEINMKKNSLFIILLVIIFCISSCNRSTPNNNFEGKQHDTDNIIWDEKTKVPEANENSTDEPIEPVVRVVYSTQPIELSNTNVIVYNNPATINLGMEDISESVILEKSDKSIQINESSKVLKYMESRVYSNSEAPETILKSYGVDIYTDDEGRKYEFYAETDTLSFFTDWRVPSENATNPKKSSEISSLADKLIAQYAPGLDISFFEKSIKEDAGMYYVKYNYKFCGYNTDSEIYMSINSDGKLAVYHSETAFIFQDWEGIITADDINEAAATISYPSNLPINYTEQKLVMGDDGYMYLKMIAMMDGYTETDESGNHVNEILPTESICYIRVIPESKKEG